MSNGKVKRATPHDTLSIFGPLIKKTEALAPNWGGPTPTRLLLNGSLTPDEAELLVKTDRIDAAVFGSPWVANPDLYHRIVQGKPLATVTDPFVFYNFKQHPSEGYTDFPRAM
jgi:2,4-dienoyl-CoA reductase-like NADH-dependent reductase (Old Yellow Enzyme family)